MTFAFDLISDLHIDTWKDFDWTGQATSPYCVVAGDVTRDRAELLAALEHLGQCYPGGVFYIDGNDEHSYYLDNLGDSYRSLYHDVSRIKNIVYLQDNVVIINGVAILATNGWWSYDFDSTIDLAQTVEWYRDRYNLHANDAMAINGIAYNDAAYIINSVRKLQTHNEVKAIVLVSHTVPAPWIIEHDIELAGSYRFNCMGNRHLARAIAEDTESKIHTWCFGHYHKSVDRNLQGIRYVNNCRGRGDSEYCQISYFPKRIEIDF
jgi:predicted phosphodiesterase